MVFPNNWKTAGIHRDKKKKQTPFYLHYTFAYLRKKSWKQYISLCTQKLFPSCNREENGKNDAFCNNFLKTIKNTEHKTIQGP